MYTTPRKRINDENASQQTPSRPSHSSFRFRTPLQAVQPTLPRQDHTPVRALELNFVDGFTPLPKKRRIALTEKDISDDLKAKEASRRKEKEQKERVLQQQGHDQLDQALAGITAAGYTSLNRFLSALINTSHPSRSSQVSRLLKNHGPTLLDDIRVRQPKIVNDWAISTTRQLAASEADALARHFCPARGSSIHEILGNFSMAGFLQDAERIAPTIYQTLRVVGLPQASTPDEFKYKRHDLILATMFCMLAKSRSEHATEFQTTMCLYLLACGTSKSMFNVLNHAGITLSYSQAVEKLKKLGQEQLEEAQSVAHLIMFMLIWDNLNFAFKVSEQRQDSKDHFDNGTTATLVPLYGVKPGTLPTSLKETRQVRASVLNFDASDLLPSLDELRRTQEGQLWHIEDILYDAYPDLRERLSPAILPAPTVQQIPVHKTKQHPLPAMHIDESSLEGTLNVLSTILRDSLKLSEEDIKKHGIIICAGDQLSLSLLDKASAIRRDDSDFMDNIGCYTEGQEGLLHIKFSVGRMVGNEHWGKPNALSPWSLWKVNTLLGRKAIRAGWDAKSPPPFRQIYELILILTLPANILDAFRIQCGEEELDTWVAGIKSVEDIRRVSQLVLDQHCSGNRVQTLRNLPPRQRDVPLENIILFNRDALHLRQLKYAIKKGDVGVVLDLASHLMLAFRGTGKTPKYADALFGIVVRLRKMAKPLRDAWLNNWLANLTGKVNGFKEMDLLQEHQNFWLKVIYSSKGSNRTWEWLSMVSVSIFALRDVMRNVNKEFHTPFNSIFHTSPLTLADILVLLLYLRAQRIQEYFPTRENNHDSKLARDLIQVGAEYGNTGPAYRNFKYAKVKTKYHGVPVPPPLTPPSSENPQPSSDQRSDSVEEEEEEEEDDDNELDNSIDAGSDLRVEFEDLLLDDDEYPMGTDGMGYISMMRDIVEELNVH